MKYALATFAVSLAQASNTTPGGGAGPVDREMLIWAVVAFALAILLVIVEAFLPSGGIIGALAGVCALVGVICFFRFDTLWGMISLALTLLAAPFLLMGLLWVWPNTIVGRWLTLDDEPEPTPTPPEVGSQEDTVAIGSLGQAITDLRPVGACRLSGKRIDCIAQAGVIQAGTEVRVIAVEGGTIKVKPA